MTTLDTSWQTRALCAETDPEAFSPDVGGSVRAAKAVCAACDVTAQCLSYALATKQNSGVWGGTTAQQRRRLLRDAA